MTSQAAGLLTGSQEPLASCYDAAFVDLDGVVYLGGSAIPGVADTLCKAAAAGMRLAYVTNNASRTPSAVASQLAAMGVPARADDVVTSAQAAARLLAQCLPGGAAVLVVGATSLRLAVRERGLRPVSAAAERPAAVVQGFTPDLSYSLLAEAALAVTAGAVYVVTNRDLTLPTARGRQPGNGALAQVIVAATGRHPQVAGKPETALHEEAVARTGAQRPLVAGDRLDTDIASATRAGTDSLLVLSGVTRPRDLVLAPPGQRPTYLAADLSGLLAPHPAVTPANGGFRCGGWLAACEERGKLRLAGSGAPLDGLRALCAAAWSGAGSGEPALPGAAVDAALAALGL
jgi:glycerol 3-phosphatase-2